MMEGSGTLEQQLEATKVGIEILGKQHISVSCCGNDLINVCILKN